MGKNGGRFGYAVKFYGSSVEKRAREFVSGVFRVIFVVARAIFWCRICSTSARNSLPQHIF